jgi:hypothetical protein
MEFSTIIKEKGFFMKLLSKSFLLLSLSLFTCPILAQALPGNNGIFLTPQNSLDAKLKAQKIKSITCSGSVCQTPRQRRIRCEEVNIVCNDGNQLGGGCDLDLPSDGAGGCGIGLSPGEKLSNRDLRSILRSLRNSYRDVNTYGLALTVCISAHEIVHAIDATSGGSGIKACKSEGNAYNESIACLQEALNNDMSQSDREAIENLLDQQKAYKDYNACLCSASDSEQGGSWSDTCAACLSNCDNCDNQSENSNYCEVNDPDNPVIIG